MSDSKPTPTEFGYYLRKGNDEEPHEVIKEDHRLDLKMVKKINTTTTFQFPPCKVKDSQTKKTKTDLLEAFVKQKNAKATKKRRQPRKENSNQEKKTEKKLQIFAQGGPYGAFLASTTLGTVETMAFEYYEKNEEKILRLYCETSSLAHIFKWDMAHVGEARLMGKKGPVEYGKNCIYKVTKIESDDYDLYYSKEVDGFDSEDKPIEIRTVLKSSGLKSKKILYKGVIMSEIDKVVAIIHTGPNSEIIDRVSIIDTFKPYNLRPENRTTFFDNQHNFIVDYLPVFKKFKRGKMTRFFGGTIVQPDGHVAKKSATVFNGGLDEGLRTMMAVKSEKLQSDDLKEVVKNNQNKSLYFGLNGIQPLKDICASEADLSNVAAVYVQNFMDPFWPRRQVDPTDLERISFLWRKVIGEGYPNLLELVSALDQENVYFFGPRIYYFPKLPVNSILYNNAPWRLPKKNIYAALEKKADIEKFYNLMLQPFPQYPQCQLTIYTYMTVGVCKKLLKHLFKSRISFDKKNKDSKLEMIHCEVVHLEKDKESSFSEICFDKMKLSKKSKTSISEADLYLVPDDFQFNMKLDNKGDLQLISTFKDNQGLDENRIVPERIALFTGNEEERQAVMDLLRGSYIAVDSFAVDSDLKTNTEVLLLQKWNPPRNS